MPSMRYAMGESEEKTEIQEGCTRNKPRALHTRDCWISTHSRYKVRFFFYFGDTSTRTHSLFPVIYVLMQVRVCHLALVVLTRNAAIFDRRQRTLGYKHTTACTKRVLDRRGENYFITKFQNLSFARNKLYDI